MKRSYADMIDNGAGIVMDLTTGVVTEHCGPVYNPCVAIYRTTHASGGGARYLVEICNVGCPRQYAYTNIRSALGRMRRERVAYYVRGDNAGGE